MDVNLPFFSKDTSVLADSVKVFILSLGMAMKVGLRDFLSSCFRATIKPIKVWFGISLCLYFVCLW
jgi:hypothetical protein